MRAQAATNQFKDWLLEIGSGTSDQPAGTPEESVAIDKDICLRESELDKLLDHTFGSTVVGNLGNSVASILTTTNSDAFAINDQVLAKMINTINPPPPIKIYFSEDSMACGLAARSATNRNQIDDMVALAQLENLHAQTPTGMPRHKLELAVGVPIVLLRNICTMKGLCNGTRLIVQELKDHLIIAKIASGAYEGQSVMIHRMALTTSVGPDNQMELKRLQFPVRLAFAMTINKAQGQTFDRVGLYLRSPVFAHGQLYVALSRVRQMNHIRVLIRETPEQGFLPDGTGFTKNIVFREVFRP